MYFEYLKFRKINKSCSIGKDRMLIDFFIFAKLSHLYCVLYPIYSELVGIIYT